MNNAQFAQLVREQSTKPAKRRKLYEEEASKRVLESDVQQTRNESKVQDGRRGLDLEAVRRAKAALNNPSATGKSHILPGTKEERHSTNDAATRSPDREDDDVTTELLQHDEAIESAGNPETDGGDVEALEEAFQVTSQHRNRDAILAEYKAKRLEEKQRQKQDSVEESVKDKEKVILIMDDFGRVKRHGRKEMVESIPSSTTADDPKINSIQKEMHVSRDIFDDVGDYDPLKDIRENPPPSNASTNSDTDEFAGAVDDGINQKLEDIHRDDYDMDMYSSDG